MNSNQPIESEMTKEEAVRFLKSKATQLKLDEKDSEIPKLRFYPDDSAETTKYRKAFIAAGCSIIIRDEESLYVDGTRTLNMLANLGVNFHGSSRFSNMSR